MSTLRHRVGMWGVGLINAIINAVAMMVSLKASELIGIVKTAPSREEFYWAILVATLIGSANYFIKSPLTKVFEDDDKR